MDLLSTAVVDITTLVATCHALLRGPAGGQSSAPRALREQLRREIKRGTLAYINTLARSKLGDVDAPLLSHCRLAAESHLAQALSHQAMLRQIVAEEPGALDGLAAARQDLWRLARMAIHLQNGLSMLLGSAAPLPCRAARSLGAQLRRRFRKALVAYARDMLRKGSAGGMHLAAARDSALRKIGKRSAAEAERLADIEAECNLGHAVLRQGVAKPLLDLSRDWARPEARQR